MLAMQAQDPNAILWAIATRCAGNPDATTVAGAFEAAAVVRNRPSRGTLQVTTAEDMAWLSEHLTPRSTAAAARRRGQLGLDDQVVETARGVVVAVLAEGRVRTRRELVDELTRAGVELDGMQAGHVLRHLTEHMVIVFDGVPGPVDSFRSGDTLESLREPRAREESLAEVALRYFSARGPATPGCLGWWANLTMRDARGAIEAAGGALEEVELAGESFVVPTGSVDMGDAEVDSVLAEPLLLAAFDEYLLAYRSRDATLRPEWAPRVVPGRNGMFKPVVVVDGEVVGTWSRRVRKQRVEVVVEPFAGLSAGAVDGLARRAEQYGDFLGLAADLSVVPAD